MVMWMIEWEFEATPKKKKGFFLGRRSHILWDFGSVSFSAQYTCWVVVGAEKLDKLHIMWFWFMGQAKRALGSLTVHPRSNIEIDCYFFFLGWGASKFHTPFFSLLRLDVFNVWILVCLLIFSFFRVTTIEHLSWFPEHMNCLFGIISARCLLFRVMVEEFLSALCST